MLIFSLILIIDVRQKGNTQTINNDRSHQKYENGSLLIKNIDSENEGYYFCNANNGIGIGIYTKVEIKIHGKIFGVKFVYKVNTLSFLTLSGLPTAPPHFRISSYQSNVIVGQTIEIKCIIYGDRPIVVSWYRNDNLILESSPRYEVIFEYFTLVHTI